MEKSKIRIFCKFVSVCDCIFLFIFAIAASIFIGMWLALIMYLFIPARVWILPNILLVILAIVSYLAFAWVVVHGAEILWFQKRNENRIYIIYQILSILCTAVGVITAIILGIYVFINIWLNIICFLLAVSVAILNIIGFGIKRREKEEREEKKTEQAAERRMVKKANEKQAVERKQKERISQENVAGILGLEGEYVGAFFNIKPDEEIVFGTQPKYCQVLFEDRKISRMHCVIRCNSEGNGYEITDCSRNGTFFGSGERMPFGQACTCPPGTIFTLDHQKQMFQLI